MRADNPFCNGVQLRFIDCAPFCVIIYPIDYELTGNNFCRYTNYRTCILVAMSGDIQVE